MWYYKNLGLLYLTHNIDSMVYVKPLSTEPEENIFKAYF